MHKDKLNTAVISGLALLALVSAGIIGFMVIESYSFTEAFFMTIITMATVGFREIRPLSDQGMWFTSILIILSFGIFFYSISTFTRYLLDGVFRNYYKQTKVKKRIKRLRDHVVICGFGRNGQQAAIELYDHNVPVIAVDSNEDLIRTSEMESEFLFVIGDATHDDVLESCQLEKARALITTLPEDSDNLFVVLSAREKNPGMTIISRGNDDNSYSKLKRAGATTVITPEKIGGQQMAKMVAHPDVVDFLDFIMMQASENVSLEEIECTCMAAGFEGFPIRELDSANESGANVIGLKRKDGNYIINPLPETILNCSDKLFVLGTSGQVNRLKEILLGVTS